MNIDDLLNSELSSSHAMRNEWTGELGGTEVTLYARPLCPADFDVLGRKGHRDFMVNPTMAGMADMIALKAEHENGSKIFSLNKHGPKLRKLANSKVTDIFRSLFGDDMEPEGDEQFEDRVGN